MCRCFGEPRVSTRGWCRTRRFTPPVRAKRHTECAYYFPDRDALSPSHHRPATAGVAGVPGAGVDRAGRRPGRPRPRPGRPRRPDRRPAHPSPPAASASGPSNWSARSRSWPPAAVPTDTEDERRTLRHDLRGAAGYVISACEDLGEGDTAAALAPALADTRAAAAPTARADRLAPRVPFVRPTSDTDTAADAAIRDTLAELPAAVARAAAAADRTEPGRVLLVDDNEFNRDLVAQAIRGQGHEVETATGGREAMARLSRLGRPADRRGAVRPAHARRHRHRPAEVG